jgi:hypothetical protein
MLVLCLENWKRRAEMINYCVNIVDQSMEEKRKSLTSEEGDARAQRKTQAAIFADEVKVGKLSACNSFLHKPMPREIKFTMNWLLRRSYAKDQLTVRMLTCQTRTGF